MMCGGKVSTEINHGGWTWFDFLETLNKKKTAGFQRNLYMWWMKSLLHIHGTVTEGHKFAYASCKITHNCVRFTE